MSIFINRRNFLKTAALSSIAVIAAACAPTAAPQATEAPKGTAAPNATEAPQATAAPKATEAPAKVGFQGEIMFYAQTYTPTSESPNADPKAPKREAMKTLSQQWMDLHSGITFKFMQAPEGDYISWIGTQLVGGTGPDMFWIWLGTLNQWADEGKTVSLNDYLELPNKYTPDDQSAWKNAFKDPFLDSYSTKGNWGGVPLDLVGTALFTNIDMLNEIGIDIKAEIVPELGSPKDWATMISWCQSLKDAGFMAMSAGMGIINQWWISGIFADQFLNTWISKYDSLNYDTMKAEKYRVGVISQEEIIHAYVCDNLKPFNTPELRDMYRVVKDWTQYMPVGFANPDYGNPMDLFLTNQLAMVWDGSWAVGTILQDDRRKFEFTSFVTPPVTKATSEYVPDPPFIPIQSPGYGSLSYGLNRSCLTKGNVEECVDWLMFITTPENDEMIVNEVPSFVPSIKKARSLPEMAGFVPSERNIHPVTDPYSWFGWQEDKWGDLLRREQTLYYLGEEDADTFFTNLSSGADSLLPDLIRKAAIQYSADGSWDLTQWKCQPSI
ncbi:MAG: ABC transporter substrate-binding protein [Anaerolineae bacterium]